MKAKLLALVAVLSALGAGTVVFLNWSDAEVQLVLDGPAGWQHVNRAACVASACNTAQCSAAVDHLQDAGSACVPRFVECPFRISHRVRTCFADAGVAMAAAGYQQLKLIALRCPGADGGQVFGVPLDDAGCPMFAVATSTPLCVRAPLDGGTTCRRLESDGGSRFFGTGNVFNATEAAGSNCEPVAAGCSAAGGIVYGDSPEVEL